MRGSRCGLPSPRRAPSFAYRRLHVRQSYPTPVPNDVQKSRDDAAYCINVRLVPDDLEEGTSQQHARVEAILDEAKKAVLLPEELLRFGDILKTNPRGFVVCQPITFLLPADGRKPLQHGNYTYSTAF